ncbi:MAG: hypothetical protein HY794_09945 [Desulfarculus sp.]|nr:hypothetical protein [Desulfarculus sp.]
MQTTPRQRLRHFYDQALLSPDLLCLHCAHTAWNRSLGQCSRDRRHDCLLFVSDMVNRLADPRPTPRLAPRPPMYG